MAGGGRAPLPASWRRASCCPPTAARLPSGRAARRGTRACAARACVPRRRAVAVVLALDELLAHAAVAADALDDLRQVDTARRVDRRWLSCRRAAAATAAHRRCADRTKARDVDRLDALGRVAVREHGARRQLTIEHAAVELAA
eukprot:scaffold94700_cov65-Phaeocystis_antarctica.AAC.9